MPDADAENVSFLRRTTYSYDYLDRVIETQQWLRLPDDDNDGEAITTRYSYDDAVRELPAVDGNGNTAINGYSVAECHVELDEDDSCTLVRRHIYDAFDRIREVEDTFGHITRYEYQTAFTVDNGFQITTYQQGDDLQFTEVAQQLFNARWQLIEVSQHDRLFWELAYGFNSFNLQSLNMRAELRNIDNNNILVTDSYNLLTQNWSDFTQGNPSEISTSHITIDTNRFARPENKQVACLHHAQKWRSIMIFWVVLNKLLTVTNTVFNRIYCALGNHHSQVITYHPQIDGETLLEADCNMVDFAESVIYDAQGRLVSVNNDNGERTYHYEAHAGFWQTTVTFTHDDRIATWILQYDSVGNLLNWRDENNLLREYSYDALGRLIRVFVENQPEASFSFTYNELNLLTQMRDDLGRGTRYAYNNQGQLTVEQDIQTSNATIYGYNSDGMLATVISPLGNTTTYLYENNHHPERLTGIIDSTGNITRFEVPEDPNQLVVTDARNNQTTYTFDTYGRLWRIDDALPDRNAQNEAIDIGLNSSRELDL